VGSSLLPVFENVPEEIPTAMSPARPFRFAVQSFSAQSAKEWRERAKATEDLGYSALHLADHVLGPGPAIASTNHPIQELAAVPAIAVAAEATGTLRVGCRVFCQDYRHPAMLAKEAATLDLLSEGRLELGIGAGWLRAEYEALGIDFDPAPVRIERLAETVAVLKAHMAGGPVSFSGKHFRLEGFEGVPTPVQRPHPPLMIGGGGRKVLSLAAREAQIVSLNFNNRSGTLGRDGVRLSTASETARKIGWVREAAGDRFDSIELEIGAYFTFMGEAGEAAAGGMAKALGLAPDEMLAHPHGLFGSVERVCDTLQERRETYGISYVTIPDTAIDAFAPVVGKLGGA
jgi:probable F420-dependent oxidoreductase